MERKARERAAIQIAGQPLAACRLLYGLNGHLLSRHNLFQSLPQWRPKLHLACNRSLHHAAAIRASSTHPPESFTG
jgi:hypothetical protein